MAWNVHLDSYGNKEFKSNTHKLPPGTELHLIAQETAAAAAEWRTGQVSSLRSINFYILHNPASSLISWSRENVAKSNRG